jgi:hypothetical protein
MYVTMKEAAELTTTNGRGMKPKLQGGCSMATFRVVPHLRMLLNFDCYSTTRRATVNRTNLI